MKIELKKCPCCAKMFKALTNGIAVENLSNVLICKSCAIDLSKDKQIVYNDNILLKIVGKKKNSDFNRVLAYKYEKPKELNWFERKREGALQSAMDNKSFLDFDIHASY